LGTIRLFDGISIKKPVCISANGLRYIARRATILARRNGREACGLLVLNTPFVELLETINANKSGGSFRFNRCDIRRQLAKVERRGCVVIGTFHSHPAYIARPGKSDIHSAVKGSLMLIFDVTGNKYRLWKISSRSAREVSFKQWRFRIKHGQGLGRDVGKLVI